MRMYGRLADAVAKRDAEIEEMAAEYVEKWGYSLTEAITKATVDLKHKRAQIAMLAGLPVRKIKKAG